MKKVNVENVVENVEKNVAVVKEENIMKVKNVDVVEFNLDEAVADMEQGGFIAIHPTSAEFLEAWQKRHEVDLNSAHYDTMFKSVRHSQASIKYVDEFGSVTALDNVEGHWTLDLTRLPGEYVSTSINDFNFSCRKVRDCKLLEKSVELYLLIWENIPYITMKIECGELLVGFKGVRLDRYSKGIIKASTSNDENAKCNGMNLGKLFKDLEKIARGSVPADLELNEWQARRLLRLSKINPEVLSCSKLLKLEYEVVWNWFTQENNDVDILASLRSDMAKTIVNRWLDGNKVVYVKAMAKLIGRPYTFCENMLKKHMMNLARNK